MPRQRIHPSSTNQYVSRTAASSMFYVCWWCGGRPIDNRWSPDHILPTVIDSPLVAACYSCNMRRHGRIPDAGQIQRLFYDERVCMDTMPTQALAFCRSAAEKLLGDEDRFPSLIAKEGNKPIYVLNGRGKSMPAYENKYFKESKAYAS